MDRAGIGAQRADPPAPHDGERAPWAPEGAAAPLFPVPAAVPRRDGSMRRPDRAAAPGGLADVLAQQVLPRLLQRHGPRGDRPAPSPEPVGARWLAALARAADDDALQRAVAGMQAQGLTAAEIASEWLGPAAIELGVQWERDECSFTDVTIGVGRMQRALRRLDDHAPAAFGLPTVAAPRVLLVLAPGEQHSFGLTVVGDAFRREGWDVVGAGQVSAAQAPGCVAHERFDVVGIAVGSHATAEGVPALCAALRLATHHTGMTILVGGPFVALGGPLATPDHLGADAVAADVAAALVLARRGLSADARPFGAAHPTRSMSSPPAREGLPLARSRPTGTPAAVRR